MGNLNNISADQVKDFVKNNILLCVMFALDVVLFFSAISLGSSNAELEGKIDSFSIKKTQCVCMCVFVHMCVIESHMSLVLSFIPWNYISS